MAASGFRSKTAQPNGIASQKTRMYYLLPHIFILSLVTSSGLQFCFCSSWIAFSFTPPRKPCTVCTVLHTANLYILFQRTRGRVLHRRAVQVGAAARSTLLSYFFEITISWGRRKPWEISPYSGLHVCCDDWERGCVYGIPCTTVISWYCGERSCNFCLAIFLLVI